MSYVCNCEMCNRACHPSRATGKTFRVIMKACLAASEGNYVFIVMNKQRDIGHIKNRCQDILCSQLQGVIVRLSHIELPGGGGIGFKARANLTPEAFARLSAQYTIFTDKN